MKSTLHISALLLLICIARTFSADEETHENDISSETGTNATVPVSAIDVGYRVEVFRKLPA